MKIKTKFVYFVPSASQNDRRRCMTYRSLEYSDRCPRIVIIGLLCLCIEQCNLQSHFAEHLIKSENSYMHVHVHAPEIIYCDIHVYNAA